MSDDQLNGWCIMCGAAPGEPCTVISERPPKDDEGLKPGDPRPEPHFYRDGNLKTKPGVAVKDEPPYYGRGTDERLR